MSVEDVADDLTRDALLDGRVTLWQPRRGYRAAVDPVLLAAFAPARPGQRVLDLGCGAGAVALCLAARMPGLDLHGLEIQPDYARIARRNAAANGTALTVHEGDLRHLPAALRSMTFDLVLANPPYHPICSPAARVAGRDVAAREDGAGVSDWIDVALRRLAPRGLFVLIHLTPRLPAILHACEGRAGAIEVLPIASRQGRAAERILVRARKGSRAPLTLCAPFVLHEPGPAGASDTRYSGAALAVLRDMAAISPDAGSGTDTRDPRKSV